MIRTHVTLGILTGFLLSGCGAGSAQFDAYSNALSQTRAAVAAHRASADTAKDEASCAAERTRYGDAVRPPLSNMAMMSGGGMMQGGLTPGGMVQGSSSCPSCQDATLAQGCTQMQLELNAHLGTPCSADPAANAAEVLRDCDRMDSLLDAQQQRLHQMGG